MLRDETREKIKDIVRGIVLEEQGDSITAIRNHLCRSFSTSTTVKEGFESRSIIKEEQVRVLSKYCDDNNFWINELPQEGRYLTRGGEAKVYLDSDNRNVIKINDAVYYATWLEYFNSLALHNLIFPETLYTLLGFTIEGHSFQAILRQPYIKSDVRANLIEVKEILSFNGFENTRRNDYYQRQLGLILEDMHDENVIANEEGFFFVDTVFYIAPDGFK